jgi:hypothetical protein
MKHQLAITGDTRPESAADAVVCHSGNGLGTKHRETGQNRWDVAQPDGRWNSFDLRI